MEETSEELSHFSIGIDFLGPDPTSSKNKAEKNLQVARFANLNLNKNVACFWPANRHVCLLFCALWEFCTLSQ